MQLHPYHLPPHIVELLRLLCRPNTVSFSCLSEALACYLISSVACPSPSQTCTGDAGPIKALATTKCVAAAIENVLLAAHARNKEQWVYENAVAEKDAAISQFHSAHTTQCLLKDAVSKAEKAEAEAKTVIATYAANKVKPDEVTWLWAKKDAAWAKQDKEAVKAKLKWHSKCVVVPAKAAVRAAKAALAQNPIAKYLAAEETEAKAAAHAKAMAKTSAAAAKARAATKAAKAAEAEVEQAAETLRKAVKTARKAAKVEEAKAKVKAAAEAKVKAAVEAKVAEAAMAVVEGAKAVAAKAAAEAAADEVVSADAQAKVWEDAASKSTYAQVLIPKPANCFDTTWTAVKALVDKAVTSKEAAAKAMAAVPTHAEALDVARREAAKAVAELKANAETKAAAKKAEAKEEKAAAAIKRAELACRGETSVSANGKANGMKAEAKVARKAAFQEKKAAKKARNAEAAAARDAEIAAALANAQAKATVQAAHMVFEKAQRKAEDARRRVEKCGGLLVVLSATAPNRVWSRIVKEQKAVNCRRRRPTNRAENQEGRRPREENPCEMSMHEEGRAAKEALEENAIKMIPVADRWVVAPMTFQYSCGLSGRFRFYAGTATSTVGDLKRWLPPGFRVLDQCASGQARQPGDEALLAKAAGLFVFPPLEGAASKGGWGPSRTTPNRMSTGTATSGDGPADGSGGKSGGKRRQQSQRGPPDTQQPRPGTHTVYNRPLTAAEEALADQYLAGELQDPGDPDQVINEVVHFAPVSRLKVRCLAPNRWLNDEVVNFFMGLFQARAAAATRPALRCHFFTTQWYAKLTETDNGYDFEKVRRWSRGADIFAKDLVFFPIHADGIHWTLAIVNFHDKRLEYFNSLPGGDGGRLALVRRYMKDEHLSKKKSSWDEAGWTAHVWRAGVDTPIQNNGDDCGVFVCKTAELYAQNARLDFGQPDMPYFRRRMAIEIHNKQLFLQSVPAPVQPQPLQLTLEGPRPGKGDPPKTWDTASFHCLPDGLLKPSIVQILESWDVDVNECKFMFDGSQILDLEGATPANPTTVAGEAMENKDVIDFLVEAHTPPLTAICVGGLALVYARLVELSAVDSNPITLLVTHMEQPAVQLTLRAFGNLGDISSPSVFATQGSMDECEQGRSCGVEAVFNLGINVSAADFNRSSGAGVDPSPFRVRERGGDASAR